jgi:uncharacterized protein YecE (DUF72 family)
MNIKIGCCGFSGSRNKYYTIFDVVELQQTFYKLPEDTTISKWHKEAPEGFEFTVKAWQTITHPANSPTYRKAKLSIPEDKRKNYGFFKPTDEVFSAWEEMDNICNILNTKIIIFQTPASFTPTQEHKDNIRKFFHSISRKDYTFVWEPRGSWTDKEIISLCEELGLVHCVDPFNRLPLTHGINYFRLHGSPPGKKMYNYQYTLDDLKYLKDTIEQYSDVYCMFNNIYMKEDASNFKSLLKKY